MIRSARSLGIAIVLVGCGGPEAGSTPPDTAVASDTMPFDDTSTPDTTVPDASPIDTAPECSPGDIQKEACGKCGKRIRTCRSTGWSPWEPCADEVPGAVCKVGDFKTIPCAHCGMQKDLCDPVACTWVTGSCAGEGVCEPGEKKLTPCPPGKDVESICSSTCTWVLTSPCIPPTGWVSVASPPTSFAGRKWASGVWTGSAALVWGGYSPFGAYSHSDGASYDVASDTWTMLPAPPTALAAGRYLHRAVFDGTRMIVWGGVEGSSTARGTGARYDASTKSWTAITTTGAPASRAGHGMVWATTSSGYRKAIVWGGCASPDPSGTGCTSFLDDGAAYDPVTDSWTALPAAPKTIAGRWKHTMIWTGTEVLLFGGQTSTGFVNDAARLDPISSTWTTFGTPSIDGRIDHVGLWRGADLVVCGGYGAYASGSNGRSNGARYVPGGGWTAISTPAFTTLASPTRWGASAWFDAVSKELYVWSGWTGSGTLATDGARYDLSDTWSTMLTTGAPSARGHATTVWTGKEALIYGGVDSSAKVLDDAKIYRP